MASSGYIPWSVTAGEVPTTSYWNILGANDASFNSGNGFNDQIIIPRHINFNLFDVYSTTETSTGRLWTDGRTIYRIVLLGTMNIINGSITVAHGITGFSSAPELVDMRGSLRLTTSGRSTTMQTFYYRESGGNWIHPTSFDTTNVTFVSSYAWGTSVYTIILDYVK
jgi:hypothetical protein